MLRRQAHNRSLDGNYAVFGQVISGMDIVHAVGQVPIIIDPYSAEYDQPVRPSEAMVVSITIQTNP